jgi:monomeric sarcosine oxidase
MRHDAIVVGAGIHGLCAAFHLRRAGVRRLAVLEAGLPGHTHGSSHGQTRITRSSYHDARFVEMAREAHAAGWPALEAALGQPLRVRTPGVFFGPPGPFDAYLQATLGGAAAVEQIDLERARRDFPLLRFADDDRVLLDHSAAMVLAATTMAGLRTWLVAAGAELRWQTPVRAVRAEADAVTVATDAGDLRAPRVVLAAGPWSARLAATALPPLVVLRQTVGYFDVDAPPEAVAAGVFPVWARIGARTEQFDYGLPSHAGSGLKLARHRTTGDGDDPDAAAPPVDPTSLLALAAERLAVAVRCLRRAEPCLYTMAPGQDFTIARHPASPRLVTIAACSGHGFKFGPVVGRHAAELALSIDG